MISAFSTSLIVLLVISWTQDANSQFNAEGKKYIMDRHNEFRSQLALGKFAAKGVKKPAATNMVKLKWDSNIEKMAQIYADTCPSGHSKNRNNTGENLWWWWSSGNAKGNPQLMGNSSSKYWAGEFEKYGWPTQSVKLTREVFNTGVGHATQMAWATTVRIGCGLGNCHLKTGQKWAVACQYQPAGNSIGSDIYEVGKTCSKCPKGTKCEAKTGLCV